MTTTERFQRLYRGRETVHGQYLDGEVRRVRTIHKAPPDAAWQRHLEGRGSGMGIVPIMLDNVCYFGAIDVDDEGVDLQNAAQRIDDAGLPLVVCRSKSGGAHLYLFMRDPASARMVQQKLTLFARAIGFRENHDGRPIEIFPKQDRLRASEAGNWINLPYYGGDETNRYAVTSDGAQLTLEEFLDYAESRAITADQLEALEPEGGEADPFVEGPPCLQTLHQLGFPAGSRNQGLYNIGIFFRLAHPEDWTERLEAYNVDRMDPPLSAREVATVVGSIEKRDYVYKCGELPISPHCQKTRCRKRKFGIDAFRKKAIDDDLPEMSDLAKITTDPPRWNLEVNGQVIELTTDELMTLSRFRRACLEKLSIIVPMMKQFEWDDILKDLLENHTVIHAPEDAGVFGQFKAHLAEFLAYRIHSKTKEDLLTGRPFEEEGRVYFRSMDLASYLERRKFREYPQARIYTALRRLGAGHSQFNINGACVQVWHLPTPENEQQQEFGVPGSDEPEF